MKKQLLLLLLPGVILTSCVPLGQSDDPPAETSESEDNTRLAYYEQLAGELQKELLALKSELYVSRVEYESRIAELEKETRPENTAPPPAEDVFDYIIRGGVAEITGYSGVTGVVEIPDYLDGHRVASIAENAFANTLGITSITLPSSLETIGWFAFSGCSDLCTVSIPESVNTIGYGAFDGCADKLTLECVEGSYAYRYAISYGLRISDNQV